LQAARPYVINQQNSVKDAREQTDKTERELFALYIQYKNTELSFNQYKDRLRKMFDFEVENSRVPMIAFKPMRLPIEEACQNAIAQQL
jgi:hypothetical protein